MSADSNVFHRFFTKCPEMLLLVGIDGAIRQSNEAMVRALGLRPGEGTRLAKLVHPDDRGIFEEAWARLTGRAEPVRFEVRLRAVGRAYRALSCNMSVEVEQGEVYMGFQDAPGAEEREAFSATDSTAGESYLAELIDPVLALRLLADNLPITVWCCDRKGIFRVHQGKAAELVGMKQGDLLGLNIFELYSPEAVGNIKRAYEGENVHYVSFEYGRYWEAWHLPARSHDGEIIGIVGVGLDVSETKLKEQELSKQLELIQQQQQIIRELGTPIIQVWDEVLTVPMMGVVDSRRAADLMDDLLAEVARTRARFTILDLTGVEVLDSATASHIRRMAASIRLLGAEGIITGIQPTVAQTMIAIGVDLSTIVTLATLRDGLKLCMKKLAVRSSDLAERGGPARPGVSVGKDKPF